VARNGELAAPTRCAPTRPNRLSTVRKNSMSERTPRICCLDLDTFFVSVERLLDPSLVDRPVIVGARPGQRGVVLAASYEVRPMGVRSGISIIEATRLAPDAVFVPPRMNTYGGYAQRVRAVLERYTPCVQTASIDEFYLDFHGCDTMYRRAHDPDDDAALVRVLHEIRAAIRAEVGLPASAGVGCTRPVAKMASGLAKPNQIAAGDSDRPWGSGVVLVPAGAERRWLGELPLRRFPGIGPAAEKRLVDLGLATIEDLLALPPGRILNQVRAVRGNVERAFESETPDLGRDRPAFQEYDPLGGTIGSISNESTFSSDLSDPRQVEQRLLGLVERVCWRARKRCVFARTVTLKLRYGDFHTVERSCTGAASAEDTEVMRRVRLLLRRAWTRRASVRLLGVGLSNLVGPPRQLELPYDECQRSASIAVDQVRERFGFAAIRRGRVEPRR